MKRQWHNVVNQKGVKKVPQAEVKVLTDLFAFTVPHSEIDFLVQAYHLLGLCDVKLQPLSRKLAFHCARVEGQNGTNSERTNDELCCASRILLLRLRYCMCLGNATAVPAECHCST